MKFIYEKFGEKYYDIFANYKTKKINNSDNSIVYEIIDETTNKMIRIWCRDHESYDVLDHIVDVVVNDICNMCNVLSDNVKYKVL